MMRKVLYAYNKSIEVRCGHVLCLIKGNKLLFSCSRGNIFSATNANQLDIVSLEEAII